MNDALRPLADRMRPRNLGEFVGQRHLLGPGKPLLASIESGQLHSLILWGPPGTGKTTLARLIAQAANAHFIALSAVMAGVKDIRAAVEAARAARATGRPTLLFLDEVHRFNKAQQDTFLPYIEDGTLTFIGATTENPSFEVISALLSRARVYVLRPLSVEDLLALITSNEGFSVVAPMKVSVPSSRYGRKVSCWALLKRCTSSRNNSVGRPCAARAVRAASTAARMSFTPAITADNAMNSALAALAMRRASVVLPVPGGPQRINECSCPASMLAESGFPEPSRWRWPTNSSTVRGRIRSACGTRVDAVVAGVARGNSSGCRGMCVKASTRFSDWNSHGARGTRARRRRW